MSDGSLAVDAAWNDRRRSSRPQRLAEAVGVVAAVGDKAAEARDMLLQEFGRLDV